MEEIKNRVGPNFPVTYRYCLRHYLKAFDQAAVPGEEFTELRRDMDESIQMVKLLEEGGMTACTLMRVVPTTVTTSVLSSM